MNTNKPTADIVVQAIIGNNNNVDFFSNSMNSSPNINVINLLDEHEQLKATVRWAKMQIRIRDIIIKKSFYEQQG